MPTINRPLAGPVLALDLDEQVFRLTHSEALARSGRSARTLVKDGPLRVTLVTLGDGGDIAEHAARGPVTVQPILGTIRVRVGQDTWRLEPGDLLSIGAQVPHAVESDRGGVFLLTLTSGDCGMLEGIRGLHEE